MDNQERKALIFSFSYLCHENGKYLKKRIFKPFARGVCMRMILFYQRHLSAHTCKYQPTCSQYTLESINNRGVVLGILLGCWRILRCNPLFKGGYDPASEKPRLKKWLL